MHLVAYVGLPRYDGRAAHARCGRGGGHGTVTAGVVRAIAGDISAGDLGVVNSHDHLFLSTPVFAGQELSDAESPRRAKQSSFAPPEGAPSFSGLRGVWPAA